MYQVWWGALFKFSLIYHPYCRIQEVGEEGGGAGAFVVRYLDKAFEKII